ncbi:hypothetical protein Cfor_02391, partial [Coptotermes formosanus]
TVECRSHWLMCAYMQQLCLFADTETLVFNSRNHNGVSVLLHCKSAHSFKQRFVAEHLRQKRAICDLLSFEVGGSKLNDSACAAHCLTKWRQGYRGGRCVNGICVCRK